MVLRFLIGFAIAMAIAFGAFAADSAPVQAPRQPAPTAFPAISAPVVVAQDSSCAAACQAEHDQCRVTTKGSPTCDAIRQRCLRACIASKKK